VIVGVKRTTGLRDAVGAQCRGGVECDVGADAWADDYVDAKLFAQFARQRRRVALPRRHLAARQLPQTGQLGWPRTLRDEQ